MWVGRRERGGGIPTSNQRPQLKGRTPQRDRRIMRRATAQGREARDRIGEGGGEAKTRRKPQKLLDAMREMGETRVEGEKSRQKVDKKVFRC